MMRRHTKPPPATVLIPERGALKLWWRQLEEKKRTKFDADPLRDAAIYEANAREYAAQGLISLANDDRRRAIEIIDAAGIVELQRKPAPKPIDPFQSVPVRRLKRDPFAGVNR